MAKILVYIDAPMAVPTAAQRELLALAARLGEPVAVLGAAADAAAITGLGTHGATAVLGTGTPALVPMLIAPQAALVAAAARHIDAAAVLLPNTADGKEIAARAAIKLDTGVITDAIDVAADFTVTKPVLAGSFTVSAQVTRGIPVITVKSNSIEVQTPSATVVELEELELGEVGPGAEITGSVESPATGRPDLQEASIVVAGGRGVDGDFAPVVELADALGAAIGASRFATDAGWIDHSAQVGQTGKTVSPQLYISAGISGAIQQKAGMQTAKVIVAVNNDPDALVFEIADFGIVGDLATVLPQAAAEIKRRKG